MSPVAGITLYTTTCRFTREQLDYLDDERPPYMSRSTLIRVLLGEAIAAREAAKALAGDPS